MQTECVAVQGCSLTKFSLILFAWSFCWDTPVRPSRPDRREWQVTCPQGISIWICIQNLGPLNPKHILNPIWNEISCRVGHSTFPNSEFTFHVSNSKCGAKASTHFICTTFWFNFFIEVEIHINELFADVLCSHSKMEQAMWHPSKEKSYSIYSGFRLIHLLTRCCSGKSISHIKQASNQWD